MSTKGKQAVIIWVIASLCLLVVVVAMILSNVSQKAPIDNFQACKDAGGRIAESFPEQCFIDGDSFINQDQAVEADSGYIGLSELEAIKKAADNDKPARVVARDGKALPVTMDYVQGRLNFHIRDGKVEKVDIEGDE